MIVKFDYRFFNFIKDKGHSFEFDINIDDYENSDNYIYCPNECGSYFWINTVYHFHKNTNSILVYSIFDFRNDTIDESTESCSELIMKKILI